jgi:hypothetical protein
MRAPAADTGGSLPLRPMRGSRLSGVGHPEVVYLKVDAALLSGMNTFTEYDRWAGPTVTTGSDPKTTDNAP